MNKIIHVHKIGLDELFNGSKNREMINYQIIDRLLFIDDPFYNELKPKFEYLHIKNVLLPRVKKNHIAKSLKYK